jgi:hypothetical protein
MRDDYQFAVDCLSIQDPEVHDACQFVNPAGACDNQFRTTGRNHDTIHVHITGPSTLVAGYATGHEAVTLTPQIRIILSTKRNSEETVVSIHGNDNEIKSSIVESPETVIFDEENKEEQNLVDSAEAVLEDIVKAANAEGETVKEMIELEQKLEVVEEVLQHHHPKGNDDVKTASHQDLMSRIHNLTKFKLKNWTAASFPTPTTTDEMVSSSSTTTTTTSRENKYNVKNVSMSDSVSRRTSESENRTTNEYLEKIREHIRQQNIPKEQKKETTEEHHWEALKKALNDMQNKKRQSNSKTQQQQQLFEKNSRVGESVSRFDEIYKNQGNHKRTDAKKRTNGDQDNAVPFDLAKDSYRSFIIGVVLMIVLNIVAIKAMLFASKKHSKGRRDL